MKNLKQPRELNWNVYTDNLRKEVRVWQKKPETYDQDVYLITGFLLGYGS